MVLNKERYFRNEVHVADAGREFALLKFSDYFGLAFY